MLIITAEFVFLSRLQQPKEDERFSRSKNSIKNPQIQESKEKEQRRKPEKNRIKVHTNESINTSQRNSECCHLARLNHLLGSFKASLDLEGESASISGKEKEKQQLNNNQLIIQTQSAAS